MNEWKRCCVVLAGVALVVLVGCTPQLTMDDLKAMKPQRPVELDRLNAFAGDWESEAEMTIPGLDEVITGKGSSSATWECDGMMLVERSDFEMGELGSMSGITVYTWDPKSKVYRAWWFNSWGEFAAGTMRYNEAKKTWKLRAKSKGAMGTALSEMVVECVDENATEWTFTEWDSLRLCKHVEGKGVSTRK